MKTIRILLALVIGINELIWYGYVISQNWVVFPYGLPFDLCDLVLWLTVYTLLTLRQEVFDLVYYWGLAGTGMAVLTPDLGTIVSPYITIKFFIAHGGVVLAILFLVFSKSMRPGKDSWRKSFIWLNAYAAVIGIFNLIFHTNYFYLCYKPFAGSLLDYFGPWPWYILAGEGCALLLFFLLWLPFWKGRCTEN